MRTRKLWIGCLIVLAALVPATASAQDIASPKWTPWVELGGVYGSNDSSRGEAVLWVPLAQSQTSVLFGEARGKLFEDDMREGNFALGYRQMQTNGWNLGVWGGYDVRRSEFGSTFHQLAGGIEALSDRWDFRANAYLPLNDSENVFTATALASNSVVELSGNQIGMVTTVTSTTTIMEELALWGFDAEIGAKIFSTPLDLTGPHHELRIYAGAYHFDHSDLPSSVTGPRVRAEWRMDDVIDQWAGSRLTLEAEYSHDQLRDDRVEVGARLRLPFGETRATPRLTAQERRMADGLERDTDIVTDTKTTSSSTSSTATEAVEDAETGVRFDRVATVDATGSLTATSSAAGANSLIIADGSAGDITGAHTLQGDQTLQGGGSTIQVRGVTSGIVVDFTADGTRPHFFNAANSNLMTLSGSNVRITSVDIQSGGNDATFTNSTGIRGVGINNGYIDRVNVSQGRNGIVMFGNGTVIISEVTISDVRDFGIAFSFGATAVISNSTISGTLTRSGVLVENGASASIFNTTIRDTGESGIHIFEGGNVDVWDSTIENTATHGVNIEGSGATLNFNNSTLAGTIGGSGIRSEAAFGDSHEISGTGNIGAGATLGAGLCTVVGGGLTGQITFDIGTCP